jgi:hypothetical protein
MLFKSTSVKPLQVAALLAVFACREKQPPKPPPPPDPLAVHLLAPGAEPKRLLHYAIPKGASVPLELALDVSLVTDGLGGAMPTFVFDLDLAVEDVLPDGRMLVRATITDASARDRPESKVEAKAVASRVAAVKGVVITGTLTPDGKLEGAKVDAGKLPDTVAAQAASLTESFEHIAMPLPTVPIGVGAKWTTTRELDNNGMHSTATNTVEVTSLDPDKVGFAVTTAITGPPQTVMQQNVAIDVSALTGSGGGSGSIDLAHFTMTYALTAKLHADMAAQGQKSSLDLEMTTTITSR